LADKKELKSILLSIGFEMVENIAKKAEDNIKTLQNIKHPFAPFHARSNFTDRKNVSSKKCF